MNKKIVLVDVGTHIGQEYKAIFQYSVLEYLYKFFKIRLISLVFRKKELNTIGLMESISIIRHAYQIRGKRNSFRIVFVEPNAFTHNAIVTVESIPPLNPTIAPCL